jgi:hypothetical protein
MLSDRELRDLSGKSCPHEEYDNYRREHAIAYTPKPPPEEFLLSPEAVERDMKESRTKYVTENPDTAGAGPYPYWFGYMNSAYIQLWNTYQALLRKTARQPPCTCQQARNGD